MLEAGAKAVYHKRPCGWLWSMRLCCQPGGDVGQKSRSGVWRQNSAIGCGSCDQNEPEPRCTAKPMQLRQSDVAIRFMIFFLRCSITGLFGALGMSPTFCAATRVRFLGSQAPHRNLGYWKRVRVLRRYLGPKRMPMVLFHVVPPHHHRGVVLELVYDQSSILRLSTQSSDISFYFRRTNFL